MPSDPAASHTPDLEPFRPYLRVLAELEMTPRLGRRVDPSDIVQETLLKACVAIERDPAAYRDHDAVLRAGWLRKILANTVSNLRRDHRAARRDVRRERSLEASLERSSLRLERLVAGPASTPSQHAMQAERLQQVSRALTALPEDQRRAIILQRLEGLPLGAIAERLDRSKDAVTSLIRRGLERLEQELERDA